MIDTLRSDLRYAVRALAKNPRFSVLVIGTMALGIAATTAVYSVIDEVMVRSLPFPEADRFAQFLRRRSDGKGGAGQHRSEVGGTRSGGHTCAMLS